MSETSETKDRVELEDNAVWFDGRIMFDLGAKATSGGIEDFIELADADVLDALNAALNAPCGPGLTEEMDSVWIRRAMTHLGISEALAKGDPKKQAWLREIYEGLRNLLDRDAKADTVTVSRDWMDWTLEELRNIRDCAESHIGVCASTDDEDQQRVDEVDAKIAEAEAALTKGGE